MTEGNSVPAQSKFRRQGLGYVYDTEGFRLTLSRIKRGSENTSGYLYVESMIDGMAGPLVANRFNVDSLTARKNQATHLSGKTNGMQVNWIDVIDRFCLRIANAEMSHEAFTTVGDLPEKVRAKWLIRNAVLENQTCTIFAPGGTGKSYLGIAIATSLQTGMGIVPGLVPTKKGRAAMLDYETIQSDVDARVKDICAGAGIPPVSLGYLKCTASVGDMVEEIARYVTSEGIDLLILDSVEMAIANQRETNDANQAIIDLYKALRMLETSVLLIDHVNATEATKTKGNRRPYGSIYKINLARIAFELRLGGSDGGAASVGFYNVKRNDGPLLKPIGLKVDFTEDMVRYSRQNIADDAVLAEAMNPKDRVYGLLQKKYRMKVKDIAEELDMTEAQVRVVFSEDKGKKFQKLEEKEGKAAIWCLKSEYEEPF